MSIIDQLKNSWSGVNQPFIITNDKPVFFNEIDNLHPIDLSQIKSGSVVALIGDFNPESILTLLRLIELKTIIVPLLAETGNQHEYFFDAALVDFVIEGNQIRRITHHKKHDFIQQLRTIGHAGLVVFSTGTTGKPKAVLHDFTLFLKRFETPRPTFRTLNFLLFDHIGGVNTLFHTLFNRGTIITISARTVETVLETCRKYDVEVLPVTPTFMRMMLMSGYIPELFPNCIKIITYGTESMDQSTLNQLTRLLPEVDFRQKFGLSEFGIFLASSVARDSLFMKIGRQGDETKVIDNILYIRTNNRMIGYLNAPSPFDAEGWYKTNDIVEEQNGCYKIIGRSSEVINVGGLKFLPSEVEKIALEFPGIELVKVMAKPNPITGQHVELIVQTTIGKEIDKTMLMGFLKEKLQPHMVPRRITIDRVAVGHRFKKA